jgi:predicted  nucleic acid-binding Zn-ribbon protein
MNATKKLERIRKEIDEIDDALQQAPIKSGPLLDAIKALQVVGSVVADTIEKITAHRAELREKAKEHQGAARAV